MCLEVLFCTVTRVIKEVEHQRQILRKWDGDVEGILSFSCNQKVREGPFPLGANQGSSREAPDTGIPDRERFRDAPRVGHPGGGFQSSPQTPTRLTVSRGKTLEF